MKRNEMRSDKAPPAEWNSAAVGNGEDQSRN